ncbi:MAG: nuclear transport factor 2 family protein [Anaerolineales bacterium]|jgi:ketosteroid isomerase-like protein
MRSDADMRSQVRQVLERFNHLVSTKNMQVLAEFAPGDAVLLIGSEAGEIAKGREELGAFFARIFARETTFSWEWDRIDASRAGDVAWFFAEGWVILSTEPEQPRSPYRISGVLERHGEHWLWRQYHGSEPVTNV